jgi:hypothetical protein
MRSAKQVFVRMMATGVVSVAIGSVSFSSIGSAQEKLARVNYTAIPLSSFQQSPLGGDPNQLPLTFLSGQLGKSSAPKLSIDRSNPQRFIATVTLTNPTASASRYRVEMEPNQSPCSCKEWKVVWVGKQ